MVSCLRLLGRPNGLWGGIGRPKGPWGGLPPEGEATCDPCSLTYGWAFFRPIAPFLDFMVAILECWGSNGDILGPHGEFFWRRWGVPGVWQMVWKCLDYWQILLSFKNTTKMKNLFQRGPIFFKKKNICMGFKHWILHNKYFKTHFFSFFLLVGEHSLVWILVI